MSRSKNGLPATWTIGDLLKHFGGISPQRIRLRPAPGTATERDVIDIQNHEDRLYELVDGVLVEKIIGFPESCLTVELVRLMGNFVDRHDLGIIAGADGAVRLMPSLVRIPDISLFRGSSCQHTRFPRIQSQIWLPIWRWKSSARATPRERWIAS